MTDVYIGPLQKCGTNLRKYGTNLRTFTEIRNKFTDNYGNTEKIYGQLRKYGTNFMRDATFNCQIKDDIVFHGTGGNPLHSTSVTNTI